MEGEVSIKINKEADTDLILVTFEGDSEPDGDNQLSFTMSIKFGGFSSTFNFEAREVDGVSYQQDPITGEWEIDEIDADGTSTDASEAVFTGELKLEDPAVELDSLEGDPVYRLMGREPDDPEVDDVVLWVGIDDLLIRQVPDRGKHAGQRV